MKRVRQAQQWGGETSAKGITLAHRQDRNRVVSVGSRAAGADAVQAGHGRRQPDGPVSNFIDRRRPTGCRSRQAGSPDVSEPWAHPRSTPRSFAAFADCHAISRAAGSKETRTSHGFRCFPLCPSLFGRATSKTHQLLRGCDMNAVYFVSPARKPHQGRGEHQRERDRNGGEPSCVTEMRPKRAHFGNARPLGYRSRNLGYHYRYSAVTLVLATRASIPVGAVERYWRATHAVVPAR